MIVVTGATGHIGNVLVRELLTQGKKVRVLILPHDDIRPIENLDVEKIEGDILNPNSLTHAFEGADMVFHLAAAISIQIGKKRLLQKINVEGTKNVIEACVRSHVRRLVYTSSIHAFKKVTRGAVIDERVPFDPDKFFGSYDRTKAEAALWVLRAVRERNLDAVVVCPSGIIGPYDFRVSQMGHFLIYLAEKKLKAYVDGFHPFVDVRDAARGHISAAEKGRRGEVYILSGEKVSISEIMQIAEKTCGIKIPRIKLPRRLILALYPFLFLYYKISRKEPLFTAYSLHTLGIDSPYSHEKASREFGYSPRPIKESIKDAIDWFRQNGYSR